MKTPGCHGCAIAQLHCPDPIFHRQNSDRDYGPDGFFSREKAQKPQKHVKGGTKGVKIDARRKSQLVGPGLRTKDWIFCASCAFSRPTGNSIPQDRWAVLRIAGAVNVICGPACFF
jgi:NAD-dependent dihydropyrimidine dehydrogenase PreA subunit